MSGIDGEIGRRVRAVRRMRGMSTEQVAARIGVAYQQIHKYEAGSNRLSAGRLFELARLFDVPIGTFFETVKLAAEEQERERGILDSRGYKLAHEFDKLPEAQKRAVLSLVQSLSFMHSSWDEPKMSRRQDGS